MIATVYSCLTTCIHVILIACSAIILAAYMQRKVFAKFYLFIHCFTDALNYRIQYFHAAKHYTVKNMVSPAHPLEEGPRTPTLMHYHTLECYTTPCGTYT